MIYCGQTYKCESCCRYNSNIPWDCPVCGKETCDYCFDRFGLCKDCSNGKTDSECLELSKRGGWDWV